MAGDGGGALQAREGGRDEWLRLYNRLVAMLRKSKGETEALLAERDCLQELIKILAARDAVLRDSLRKTQTIQSCLSRCYAETLDLLQIQIKQQDDDLEYLAAENNKLKLKLKEIESSAELGEKSTDPQRCAREFRAERRERKKSYKALMSDNDKLQNMHSLASENDEENPKLKAGHLQVLSVHDHMAVKLLKTSITSEVDPSDSQDAEDGTKVPAHNNEEHPEQGGAASSQNGPDEPANVGKKKLVITEEHFQRVTQSLVMRLQHEESVMKDGGGLAGMKQRDLIMWYVEQQNAQGVYSCTEEVKDEVKCIKAIIERLIQCGGRLIVIDEGTSATDDGAERRGSENRLLAVKT